MLRALIPLNRLVSITTQLKPQSNPLQFNRKMSSTVPDLANLTINPFPTYEASPIPHKEGEKYVEKACMLVIGDEVLNLSLIPCSGCYDRD